MIASPFFSFQNNFPAKQTGEVEETVSTDTNSVYFLQLWALCVLGGAALGILCVRPLSNTPNILRLDTTLLPLSLSSFVSL